MKLSKRWLDEFVKLDVSAKEFSEAITMSGSKVESFYKENDDIRSVVVGKITKIEKHPNADKLQICQVDIGNNKTVQIVTAATNINVGNKVPVALDGAYLSGGNRIFNSKLRGVDSFGMFCSVAELGLTTNDFPYAVSDGIFIIEEPCEAGDDVCEAVGLNDTCFDFEITSNRPDCFSVIGLAREAAATYDKPFNLHKPEVKSSVKDTEYPIDAEVLDPDLCPCYCCRVVKNVKIEPSPRWLRERLRAMGVRPINNIVDITNYLMLEYGQPMHAFDYNNIEGHKIIVRRAKKGEQITTLDDTKHILTENQLVIADTQKPIAIAGVMGGEFSSINDNTTTIVFESAMFKASSVRLTARNQGMRTDSSALYEKGLDPNNCVPALDRACELIEMLSAGIVTDTIVKVENYSKENKTIEFNPSNINDFLGSEISEEQMRSILNKIDCKLNGNTIVVPTFRPDLECEADIAEEIARFYGYNNIASVPIQGSSRGKYNERQLFDRKVKNTAISLGYSEIFTYSFISPKEYDKILMPIQSELRNSLKIKNPLGEDTSIMRTTAIPSMLKCLSYNYSNRNMQVRLFEIAKEYIKTTDDELPIERQKLLIGAYGENEDFFELKGSIEKLFEELHIDNYDVVSSTDNFCFHPGRCANFIVDGEIIGTLGEIHPIICENFVFPNRVYVADFDMEKLFAKYNKKIVFSQLPKFPSVARDLAMICDKAIPVVVIKNVIKNICGNLLEEVKLFDVYEGENIGKDKKSIAYRIVLRSSEGTLKDEQANDIVNKIIAELEKDGMKLRA